MDKATRTGLGRIGVVDTMFARIAMGDIAESKLATMPAHGERFTVLRRTVPGIKDLAVACKRLIGQEGAT